MRIHAIDKVNVMHCSLWLPLVTVAVAILALLSGSNGRRHEGFGHDDDDDDGPRDRRGRGPPNLFLSGPFRPYGGPGHFDGPFGGPGHIDHNDHNCKNFTWFSTTNATSGATCLTELPTANNVTAPFYNNQTLLEVRSSVRCSREASY
jgi:hypothetical protein